MSCFLLLTIYIFTMMCLLANRLAFILVFVEFLRCVGYCFSINLQIFYNHFFEYFLCSFLFLWYSHYMHVGALNGTLHLSESQPHISESLFNFLLFFFFPCIISVFIFIYSFLCQFKSILEPHSQFFYY